MNQQIESLMPGLAGHLYFLVSEALFHRGQIELERRPRLADFGEWVEGAAEEQGWEKGEFVGIVEMNRKISKAEAADSSALAQSLIKCIEEEGRFEGSISDLLAKVRLIADEDVKRSRDFPVNASHFGRSLRRLQPALREVGIGVEFQRSSKGRGVKAWRVDLPPLTNQSPSKPVQGAPSSSPVEWDSYSKHFRQRSADLSIGASRNHWNGDPA